MAAAERPHSDPGESGAADAELHAEHHGPGHSSGHGAGHGHGHANDRGLAAIRRYLKQTPRLWRSDLNDAVVDRIGPTPSQRVLDIGAGMGAGVLVAARSGAMVIAVEPTPFLRRVLRARSLLHPARSRITVVDGAAENLTLPDRSIDAAWAVNAMHHWVDLEVAAAEVARVLRPGGRVLLVDEDFADPEHPDAARYAKRAHGPHRHGFDAVQAENVASILGNAGLVEVEASKGWLAGRPGLIVTAQSAV